MDIHRRVLDWYARHARSFPWRGHLDPYAVLVSEVMLQQTQTSRVVPAFEAFLRRFPTVAALAAARPAEVIRAWQGLGYNRRAVALRVAARAIVRDHGGTVPSDPAVLRSLPGIGEYTASAVACFAYGAAVPVVVTNVVRVLGRAMLGVDAADAERRAVSDVARSLVPLRAAPEWNQALMDIGATICRPRAPTCERCPLRGACAFTPDPSRMSRRKGQAFEGSTRQARGRIVAHLRAHGSASVATLQRVASADHAISGLLSSLERDGLVALGPQARRGSARGVVRLPG